MTVTAADAGSPPVTPITAAEFRWISTFLSRWTGIELRDGRQTMVMGRLERRLRHHGLTTYTEYFRLLARPEDPEETRIAIDLLTTNETYFFREPVHFDRLPELLPERPLSGERELRVWSAASSTGEEAYSIALTLAGARGTVPWRVVGTDISTRVLETARHGLFPVEAAERIPEDLRRRFCLRGRDRYEGMMTIRSELRRRLEFHRVNLTRPLPAELGTFDVVFLRNVMIYFGQDTKQQLVDQITARLRPGGHLVIGHAETLSGLDTRLHAVGPSIHRLAVI